MGDRGVGLSPYVSSLHGEWLGTATDQRWDEVPGTLVFADVSGFTPLAERLARRGKVGAEELTDTLNLVFTRLLEVAGRFGGDCLKFGGDALLLHYRGRHHARRGAAAAHAMQAALRDLRRQDSAAGLAKLGISMGVHSGSFHAFLVGSTHKELVLAGPGISRTLELEAAAARSQVLVGAATAAQLEPTDVKEQEEGAFLLRRAPAAAVSRVAHREAIAAAHGIPVALRGHLDGARKDGEHRLAAVAFVKFGGTDELLARQGPGAVARALGSLITLVQASCRDYDVSFIGTDVDCDGGKVILASGMPSTSDDDEDRLLLAVQEVVAVSVSSPLSVRAGLHRGRIFAVDLGSPSRRTFTVMGDAVNLAARVMGHAPWGAVVATDALLERRRTDYHLEPLAPFVVKGKAAPVMAQTVGPPRGRRDDETHLGTPLVGRGIEVAEIRDAFAAAHQGAGRIIELIGEPGIGKSKLVAAMSILDHGLGSFVFEAGRYSLATPYFALRRGLRIAMGMTLETPHEEVAEALAGIVTGTAPHLIPWLPLLGVPLGLELPDTPETAQLDAGTRQTTMQQAVVDLMGRVLSEPTLITIEDAHWLDSASCELLQMLFTQVNRRPWAVLVTRRPVAGGLELAEGAAITRRRLSPLGRDDLVRLGLTAAGSTVLPPGVLDDLIERSDGNPLFLQELVNATVTGSLSDVPESIEAVISATIDTLPARDRSLLRHAAVLGGHVPLRILTPMVDEPPEQVELAVRRLSHFLTEEQDGSLRFRHILLRDVAYEGLSFRVRRELHERAGDILERSTAHPDTISELLSIHYDRAGRLAKSWHYSRMAGERAQHNGASVEAAAFYERALDAARQLDDVDPVHQAEVAERLGDTWELGGRYDRSTAAYRQARRLSHRDGLRQVRLCRKIGYVRDHEGSYAAAQRWFNRGLSELATVAEGATLRALRAELVTAKVSSQIRQGRHTRSEPLIESAIADAEAGQARAALAHAYFVYDQLLVDQGRYDEAHHSERAAAIYEELGDHRGVAASYNEMGTTAYWLGRWDAAIASWERAIDSDRKAGALVYNAIYLNNIGEVRSDQGRLVEAETLLREACELWTAGGWRAGIGWARSNLGRLAARDQRFSESKKCLDEACYILADIGAEALLLETEARELERCVLAGLPEDALAMAEGLRGRAERLRMASVVDLIDRLHGLACCQAGDAEAGHRLIEASATASRRRGSTYDLALSAEALARVERILGRPGAHTHEAEAMAIFAELGVVATFQVPLPGG